MEKARDTTIEQRQLEEVREQQEEDISRLQRIKECAKENILGISAVPIWVAGVLTTIIIGTQTAIVKGAQATTKFGKAVTNLVKKLVTLIVPSNLMGS